MGAQEVVIAAALGLAHSANASENDLNQRCAMPTTSSKSSAPADPDASPLTIVGIGASTADWPP